MDGAPAASFSSAPPIDTERLVLRAHRLEDFADSLALWSDPVVTRYIGGSPHAAEEVWSRLLRYAGHWAMLGFGYWVLRERRSGRFLGEVGFADYNRAIEPSIDGEPEAGWVIAPWAHGSGYASEAVRALHAWGDRHLASSSTVCLIHPGNAASIRVAEKVGYAVRVRTAYHGSPTLLYARARPP